MTRAWIIEFGWLTEPPYGLQYLGRSYDGKINKTTDANQTIKFCDKADAESVIKLLQLEGTAVEHGWY